MWTNLMRKTENTRGVTVRLTSGLLVSSNKHKRARGVLLMNVEDCTLQNQTFTFSARPLSPDIVGPRIINVYKKTQPNPLKKPPSATDFISWHYPCCITTKIRRLQRDMQHLGPFLCAGCSVGHGIVKKHHAVAPEHCLFILLSCHDPNIKVSYH